MFGVTSRIGRTVAAAALALGIIGVVAGPAHAYGTDHLFEITVSFNCQNISFCASKPFGVGGLWGWVEPDSDGSTDGAVQVQGHQNANASLNGAAHDSSIGPWSVVSCPSAAPPCALLAAEGGPTDPNGEYFLFPTTFPFGTIPLLTPHTPGKYTVQIMPGVSSSVTVTAVS